MPWVRKPAPVAPPPAPVPVRTFAESPEALTAASLTLPPCPPTPADLLMQPKTIQEARDDGARAGTMVSVPLAPAVGPITVGVAQVVRATVENGTHVPAKEPMVAVALHAFWDSPTVIKARRIIIGCALVGLGSAGALLKAALDAGKSIFQLPWGAAGTLFLTATFGALVTAYFVWQRVIDNNPIQGNAKAAP